MRTIVSIIGGCCVGLCAVCILGALAPEGTAGKGDEGKRYLPLPARGDLWMVDQVKGAIVFFKFPESDERPIQRSRTFTVDRTKFPQDKTSYVLSMREVTSVLWICNTESGEVQVLRYRRDGTFDTELQLHTATHFQD